MAVVEQTSFGIKLMKTSKIGVDDLYLKLTRWEMILTEKRKKHTQPDPRTSTMEMSAMDIENQPPDVFQRQWTPVDEENPIWKAYSAMLRGSKESCETEKKSLSACSNCLTLFLPMFPEDDFHLHELSVSFRTAINKKTIRYCDQRLLKLDESQGKLEETFQYKALVGLAKEAGAYKKEQGVEFIKLIRVVHGARPHRGRAVFKRTEVCENANVEEPVEEVSDHKFKVAELATDVEKLITQ